MLKFKKDLSSKSNRREHKGHGENFESQNNPPLIKIHINRKAR
jgi:hypothetical protein